jgi:2-oxoglutarate ferredoxin oxidoreductase subunit gamma
MAAPLNLLFAGFGGQGILFAGKLVAYAGLIEGRELSWLPSYGPEMRGGTANCSVCLADEPIGSPLVLEPDVLVAINQPSLDKFIGDVVPGGKVIVDSTMCTRIPERDDVTIFPVPATQLAEEAGLKGLASVILVGKLLREIGFCDPAALDQAIAKSVPAKKAHLLGANRKAFEIGMTNEDGESSPVCSLPEGWTAG